MEGEQKRVKKVYYGWFVFGACFLMVLVALGFGSSPKATFLKPVTEQLGLERGKFMVNDAIRHIMTAVLNFSFGFLVRRIKARWMIALGFASLVISFTLNALGNDYWQFYIAGAFFGAGLAWTTTTIVGYVTENWFTNSKGTLMGIILAANGLGAFISEPIVTKLIYGADGSLTGMAARWRLAYAVCAGIFLVTGIVVTLIVRDRPEEVGLKPFGQDKAARKKHGITWTGYEMKEVFRKPFFYLSGLCTFVIGFTLQSLGTAAKPHIYDLGFSSEFVIPVFMLNSIALLVAKMAAGFLFDRAGIRKTIGLCTLAASASLLVMYFISPGQGWMAYVYAVIGAFGMPLETVLVPLLVSQLFGRKAFSHVLGYFLALNYLGYASGVVVTNVVYDHMGTYRQILFVLAMIMIVAGIVSQISIAIAERSRKRFMAAEEAEKSASEQ